MRTGDLDAAIADCRACIVIDATFVRAHERLGAIFEEQSNFSAGTQFCSRFSHRYVTLHEKSLCWQLSCANSLSHSLSLSLSLSLSCANPLSLIPNGLIKQTVKTLATLL